MENIQINFSPEGLLVLNVILGFILFGIALELKREDFYSLILNRKSAIAGLTAHFFLLPLLTFILVKLLNPPPGVALGMILVGACPGGNMSNMFTHLAKGNTALAVALTSISHVLAIFFTPFNFSFYGSMDSGTAELLRTIHLSFTDVMQTIVFVILIPLTMGMLFSYYFPELSNRLQKYMKRFSLAAFAIFLIAAFAGNASVFIKYFTWIMPLVVVHNAVALFAGYWYAKAFGVHYKDVRTITFETGVQNSGLGLILIFSFFNGMGSMALVAACWGVWHLITGGLLAYWWSRKP